MECPGFCLAWETRGPPGFAARERTTDDPDPVHHRHPRLRGRRPARAAAGDPLSRCPREHRLRPRHVRRVPAGARALLGRGVRLAGPPGRAQPDPAVHRRDRRPADPFPVRAQRASGRDAAAAPARLAGQPVPLPDRHPAAHRPVGRAACLPRHRPLPARIPLLRPRGTVVRRDGRPAGHADDGTSSATSGSSSPAAMSAPASGWLSADVTLGWSLACT